MAYKVFISHSTRDRGTVVSLAHLISRFGVEVVVANWYLVPGARIDEKVFQQIKESDCVVALLTQDGIRANWVHQELGCAISAGRPIIPLVQKGTDPSSLASLEGREHIEFDPREPQQALLRTSGYVQSLKMKRRTRESAARSRRDPCLSSSTFRRREMNTISYDPSEDELLLSFAPTEGEPTRESESLKIWWDSEGNIQALAITQYTQESKEFRKNLNTTQLGGIWRGVRITAEDIHKNREELLKEIEEKW